MGTEEYEAERSLFGDLEALAAAGSNSRIRVEAHGGATGGDLHSILERVRNADPDEPFWTGVRSMTPDADAVEIEWNERREPRLVQSGPVEVECHLYG